RPIHNTRLITQPIVDIFEYFILKCADSLTVAPPIISVVSWIKGDHANDAFAAKRATQHPTHAARRKYFRWHDETTCIVTLRPGSKGEHLLMRVRQLVAKDFDGACGHPKLKKNSLVGCNVRHDHAIRNQNPLDQSLPVILRSGGWPILDP